MKSPVWCCYWSCGQSQKVVRALFFLVLDVVQGTAQRTEVHVARGGLQPQLAAQLLNLKGARSPAPERNAQLQEARTSVVVLWVVPVRGRHHLHCS